MIEGRWFSQLGQWIFWGILGLSTSILINGYAQRGHEREMQRMEHEQELRVYDCVCKDGVCG